MAALKSNLALKKTKSKPSSNTDKNKLNKTVIPNTISK